MTMDLEAIEFAAQFSNMDLSREHSMQPFRVKVRVIVFYVD